MTIKVAHIYACKVKFNSGDFMLGIATKRYFKEVILATDDIIEFKDFDCRSANLYKPDAINKFNNYDYIIVGGGGLILPDSATNKASCWQWVIPKESYSKLNVPVYVISIGYNLFFKQTMAMPSRENDNSDPSRIPIFKDNITTLINKAAHFTIRHKGDLNSLIEVIGEEYRDKVNFEFCPVHWYVKHYWKMPKVDKKYIAIEIKDDRKWRRYWKIGRNKYYNELLKFVKYCLANNKPVLYLSHDGSRDFYNYLKNKKIDLPYLNNTCANESKIKDNYSKIHTILCSAGHSQMMAHACGIRIISMITHPKLQYFCDDIGNTEFIDVNSEENIYGKLLSLSL